MLFLLGNKFTKQINTHSNNETKRADWHYELHQFVDIVKKKLLRDFCYAER